MKAPESADNREKSFQTFEDLEVYQVARDFRKMMYRVARRLPEEKQFGLANQIRRAGVSLTSNIAEGHGRFHDLDQIRFCLNARGSLEELIDDLNVCEDEAYLPSAEINLLKQQGWRVHRVLAGYMRWLRKRKQAAALALHEDSPVYIWADDVLDELQDVATKPPASTL